MQKYTGKLEYFDLKSELPDEFAEVEENDITPKQKENMQVSKYDSISKLGKLFTGNRIERRKMAKNIKRKMKLKSV